MNYDNWKTATPQYIFPDEIMETVITDRDLREFKWLTVIANMSEDDMPIDRIMQADREIQELIDQLHSDINNDGITLADVESYLKHYSKQ